MPLTKQVARTIFTLILLVIATLSFYAVRRTYQHEHSVNYLLVGIAIFALIQIITAFWHAEFRDMVRVIRQRLRRKSK